MMTLILRIILVLIIIVLGAIIYVKYNSNFFLETSMDNQNKENQPNVLDEKFLKTLEYDYNLNILQDQMKTLIDDISEYKNKINTIYDNTTYLLKKDKNKELTASVSNNADMQDNEDKQKYEFAEYVKLENENVKLKSLMP